jgi:hypothetical protein
LAFGFGLPASVAGLAAGGLMDGAAALAAGFGPTGLASTGLA